MGKHEIRLRREQMTSRRIQRHKNYAELMRSHEKASRLKKMLRLLYALLFLLGMAAVIYMAFTKWSDKEEKQKNEDPNTIEEIRINYLDPDKLETY